MPGMAPQKKRDWERAGIQAWSHTQSCSTVIETWWPSSWYSQPASHSTTSQSVVSELMSEVMFDPAWIVSTTRAQSVVNWWH